MILLHLFYDQNPLAFDPWRLKFKIPLESRTLPKCSHLYFGRPVILYKFENFMKLMGFSVVLLTDREKQHPITSSAMVKIKAIYCIRRWTYCILRLKLRTVIILQLKKAFKMNVWASPKTIRPGRLMDRRNSLLKVREEKRYILGLKMHNQAIQTSYADIEIRLTFCNHARQKQKLKKSFVNERPKKMKTKKCIHWTLGKVLFLLFYQGQQCHRDKRWCFDSTHQNRLLYGNRF